MQHSEGPMITEFVEDDGDVKTTIEWGSRTVPVVWLSTSANGQGIKIPYDSATAVRIALALLRAAGIDDEAIVCDLQEEYGLQPSHPPGR